MKETIEMITAFIALLTTLIIFKKEILDIFSKRVDFVSILNLELPDRIKEIYVEERNRYIFKKLKGVDISSKNQILLYSLYEKLNDEYSWNQIKIASRYFKYDDGEITITIKKVDWFSMITFLILAISFIISGLIAIDVYKDTNNLNINYYLKIIGFTFISILYGFYAIDRFVAPIQVAKMIDRSMKKINNTPR